MTERRTIQLCGLKAKIWGLHLCVRGWQKFVTPGLLFVLKILTVIITSVRVFYYFDVELRDAESFAKEGKLGIWTDDASKAESTIREIQWITNDGN